MLTSDALSENVTDELATSTVIGDLLSVVLTISLTLGALTALVALLVWMEQGIAADSAKNDAAQDDPASTAATSGSSNNRSSV